MLKKLLLALLLLLPVAVAAQLLLLPVAVAAQTIPRISTNLSTTIATTNTFQTVQAQNGARQGCLIQNNSTHAQYVYLGICTNATTGTSYLLEPVTTSVPSNFFACEIAGNVNVAADQICITGTSGDTFFASFW